jgi:hypothetical protein
VRRDPCLLSRESHLCAYVYNNAYIMLLAGFTDEQTIELGRDLRNGLRHCSEALNIGCGKDQAAGTFWSGLIDDVRIYDRAVEP